ncbi:MAG: SRPBCC family protein [Dehalococcoidia bacterium]|nr:SRPBCC family protein [Dehalococcoidia bacterium]
MSSSIDIDAAGERVWHLVEHPARWAEWSKVCTEVWGVPDDGVLIEGTEFGFKLRMVSMEVPFNVSVTRIDSGLSIEWRSTKFSITAVRTIFIEPYYEGCRVTDQKKFSSPVLPVGLIYPRGFIRRMTESWLVDMRIRSESNE